MVTSLAIESSIYIKDGFSLVYNFHGKKIIDPTFFRPDIIEYLGKKKVASIIILEPINNYMGKKSFRVGTIIINGKKFINVL